MSFPTSVLPPASRRILWGGGGTMLLPAAAATDRGIAGGTGDGMGFARASSVFKFASPHHPLSLSAT